MPWGAVVGAAIIGAAGSAYSANKSSKAAKGAANTQAQAAQDSNAVQLQMYNQSRQDNEPFRQNALTAQSEFMTLLGLSPYSGQPTGMAGGTGPQVQGVVRRQYNPKLNSPDYAPWGQPEQPQQLAQAPSTPAMTPEQAQQAAFDRFRSTPGYQFGLNTGFDQVQASAAARGGLYSGATMKALQKFGNDYADQQGYSPYMNRLASLADMGQTANAQNQQAGQSYANQTGYNLANAANARASGLQTSANAWGDAAGNISGIAGWLAGQYKDKNSAAPAGLANYNWASSSGFGNNYGGY